MFSPGAAAPVVPTASSDTPSTTASGPDPLVNEARREIVDIVREVASAVRSSQSADEFLGMLVDRILRAMAAEGVLVWKHNCEKPNPTEPAERQCIRRIGRITDHSIPSDSIATHQHLLDEVSREGQPVVVPATPGATDATVPANPMDVPAAIVPIALEASEAGANYLLEVFLEPDCGVATQRGYLRFVAQMADLAGEFLRADQLRELKRIRELAHRVDDAIAQLHRTTNRKHLEAAIVDHAADLFDFDRDGLCVREPSMVILSVSHVDSIDRKSPAAKQLLGAAEYELDPDGCVWLDPSAPSELDGDLEIRAVAGSDRETQRRLVCMQVADAPRITTSVRSELVRYMQHAEIALDNVIRIDAIPGGRFLASLAPRIQNQRAVVIRTTMTTIGAMTLALVAGFFPVPLVVYSSGSIRPANVQSISAPRDAVVDQIHVQHGQTVDRGQELLTLVDAELDEQIIALVGRRAVLVQQRSHWTEAMVDSSANRLERLQQVQGERRMVTEEIQSVDDQLAVLERVKESLVIRADRSGVVDAWQINQRLSSRPLRRGELMLQVIEEDSPWMVDVEVAQSRIGHLQSASSNQNLETTVVMEADPSHSLHAQLKQIGPSQSNESPEGGSSTSVLLRLDDEASAMISKQHGSSHQAGAPTRVMFHCGKAAAGYLLFQDVIRSVRGTMALYFGSDSETNNQDRERQDLKPIRKEV